MQQTAQQDRVKPNPWELDITPATLRKVSAITFFAWVISVYDFTLFGTLLPVIAEDFGWTTAQSTTINTVAQVGVFLVSLVVGPLIDRAGRRSALIVLMIGGALASGITGMAMGVVSIVIARSLTGLSISEEVVNAVYLNEMFRGVKNRGFLYSLVQAGYPIGALLAAGLSALLLPLIGWRWSFAVAAGLALLVAALATLLPESPVFEAMKEARRRKESGDDAGAAALLEEFELQEDSHEKTRVRDVFTPELRKHTLLLSAAWLFSWVAIQVFSVLGTTVIVEAKGYDFSNALMVLIGANAVGFVGYLAHGWVGDRIGRQRTVIIGWLLGGAASLIMLFGPASGGFVVTFYAATLFFLTGPFAALLYYMGESYPARVRGMGTNVAHVMAPLGAIAGSGIMSVLLVANVPMQWAAALTGSLGLLLAALCLTGTRKVSQ